MKVTLTIPTNADWRRLDRTRESIIANTFDPSLVDIVIVDNGNTFGYDMSEWVEGFNQEYRGSVRLEIMEERGGLTTAWKRCTDASNTEWTVITNDDTTFMPAWDKIFRDILKEHGTDTGHSAYAIYLLCHPYNWSGFAVHRSFLEEFPWNLEFPSGYHEDDELYLRVATARGFTKKSEVYSKAIYCLPYVTNGRRYCFTHSTDNSDSKRSAHYTRWDQKANQLVFHKHWRQCHSNTPGAIENKNGSYYVGV
jgi:hypothetical protein